MTNRDIHKSKVPATKTAPVQRTPEQEVAASEVERTEQNLKPQFGGPPSPQQARMMQRMQRTVGNAQVQRMLNAAAAKPQIYAKPPIQTPAAITPAQRTAESAAPTQEVQRIPTTPITPIAAPTQRPSAPISRGVWDTIAGAGKSMVNKAGNLAQAGAKALFERALKAAGVDPRRVMGLITRAGGAVGSIIKNPARFGNTLVNAVRQGFGKFQGNITTHLQAGFSGWLFGTMSKANVSMPKDLSPQSVLTLVLQVLNVTPAALKQRVARQVGGQNVERAEQAWGVIGTAMRSGVGGLWGMLSEYLGDLKTLVIGGIKEWVITSVIKAAVMKIASMFNPASAIVAAIKTIYNVVTFLIQRAGQISALFSAVADSAGALAQGNTQQAAAKIEQVLARAVPVVIGFLASMVGLNGIAGKVKEIIGRVRSRVDGAIDKMITKVVSRFKGLTGKASGKLGTRAEASQANPAERNRKVQTGIAAIHAQERKLAGEGGISQKEADSIAQNVKKQHPIFQSISAVEGSNAWNYDYVIARQVVQGRQPKQQIININSLGERMKFRQSVRKDKPVRTNNPNSSDIKERYIEHRRHIVAYEALELGILREINGKTVSEAAKALRKMGAQVTKVSTQGVIVAARRHLRELHNDQENLWVGPVSENSSKGGRYAALEREMRQAIQDGDKVKARSLINKIKASLLDIDPKDRGKTPKYMSYLLKALMRFNQQYQQKHGTSLYRSNK